ncbi:MAG TPA: NAD(P)H-dependent oxidoreductase [bacterium]|nr:NAD(P)H-dependent oxidoreductase [bacterium]HXC65693.1 NAD(P)H-dependent oxidoreductase [bacterium]
MKTVLVINASPRGGQSTSRTLSHELLEALRAKEGPLAVVERDLNSTELPFLDQALIGAYYTPEDKRSDSQRQALAVSDRLVDELLAADLVVLAAPVWNFGVPASVKAWMELVARVGRTFRYTAEGPQGLIPDKPVYVVKSSGGVFSEGPAQAWDFFEGYLKHFLGFLGLKQVTVIRAEGLSLPGQSEARLASARRQIAEALQAPVMA